MATLKYVVLVLVLAATLQVLLAQLPKRGRRRRLGAPKTPSNSGYRPPTKNNGYIPWASNNGYRSGLSNGYRAGSNNGYRGQGAASNGWNDLSRFGGASNVYSNNGYNSNGFTSNAYNSNGFNSNGFNSNGFNRGNRGRNNNRRSNSFLGGSNIFAAMMFGNDIPDGQIRAAQQNRCTMAEPTKHPGGPCNCCPGRCEVGFARSRLYDECSPFLNMVPCCSTVDAT